MAQHAEEMSVSVERAQALVELKRYDEAITLLRERLATHPYDSKALVHLGFAQLFNGKLNDALETAELGISVDHSLPGLHNLRGDVLSRVKRFDEAYDSFDTALALNPLSVGARAQYIDALIADPRSTKADKHLLVKAQELADQLVEAMPDDWISHYCDARVKALGGKLAAAETAIRRSLKISPNNADAHNVLGAIQQMKGELREAGDSYVAAGRANPHAANAGGLDSLGKIIAPVGIGSILIFRLARAGGKSADLAGADVAVVLLIVAVVIAIGFAIKSANPPQPPRRDYSHLSKEAQDVINRNRQ